MMLAKGNRCPLSVCLLKCFIAFFCLWLLSISYSLVSWHLALRHALKYSDFALCIFLVALLATPASRRKTLWAFIIANCLVVAISYGQLSGLIHHQYQGDASLVFHNRITTGLCLCLAGFFMLDKTYHAKGKQRYLFAGITIFILFNLIFCNVSRSGLILFMLLVLCYCYQKYNIRGIAVGLVLIIACGISIVHFNPYLASRFTKLDVLAKIPQLNQHNQQSLQAYIQTEHKSATSVEVRIIFIANALHIIKQNPILGAGAGSYEAFNKQLIKPSKDNLQPFYTNNPHNEYLNVTSQLGVVGLFLLVMMFAIFYQELCHGKLKHDAVALAIFIAYVVGCGLNSWLLDTTPSHSFILFSALLLAQRHYSGSTSPA